MLFGPPASVSIGLPMRQFACISHDGAGRAGCSQRRDSNHVTNLSTAGRKALPHLVGLALWPARRPGQRRRGTWTRAGQIAGRGHPQGRQPGHRPGAAAWHRLIAAAAARLGLLHRPAPLLAGAADRGGASWGYGLARPRWIGARPPAVPPAPFTAAWPNPLRARGRRWRPCQSAGAVWLWRVMPYSAGACRANAGPGCSGEAAP